MDLDPHGGLALGYRSYKTMAEAYRVAALNGYKRLF